MIGKSVVVTALIAFTSVSPKAEGLTELERQRLVAHLEMTEGWLIDEVSNLSSTQLEFRRASGSWSIMEVVEHLVVVGPIYWKDLQNAIDMRASGRILASGDVDILWYGVDRTNREKAIPPEIPKGQLHDVQAGLTAYRKQHAQLLQYARTTTDDLRRRFVDRQKCDAYQWALLISTHEQRHILQIREIKRDPKFPKK